MIADDKILIGLRDILANLLTVNPYFRWTARECLAHPMFDDVRNPANEASCSHKILLSIDKDDVFDYEEGKCKKYKIPDLVSDLLIEIDEINNNWLKM